MFHKISGIETKICIRGIEGGREGGREGGNITIFYQNFLSHIA